MGIIKQGAAALKEHGDRMARLVKLAYPDQDIDPRYVAMFSECDNIYEHEPDKSTEYLLSRMCENILTIQPNIDWTDAHDVAIHYFMALSSEQSEKEDLFAGKIKDALNLPDPAASIERMAHPELDTWYHVRYYDPMAKQKLAVGFTLDGIDLDNPTVRDRVMEDLPYEINKIFNETKDKIANTIHPDCEVNGCQHAKDIGVFPEHKCRGKCHYVNFC